MKKLKSFISDECSNLVSKYCMGVNFNMQRFNDTGVCVVVRDEDPIACEFFRTCVLPSAHHKGCYNEVAGAYSFIDKKVKIDKARYCGCGVKLEKSVRLCKKCTKLAKKRGKK
jgi:hypothetical protein